MTDEQNLEELKKCCGKCKHENGEVEGGEVEDLKKKVEEYLNNWKRERADFVNYKKDEMERTLSLLKHSSEKFVLKLLPVLDNIYLAEKHLPENDEFKNGFLQIKKQLAEFFKKEGIEEIEVQDKEFDPNFMEALAQEEVEGKDPGIVIEELQKGYIMNGKVLRPAKVKITK